MKIQIQPLLKNLIKDPFWLVMVIVFLVCVLFFLFDILPLWGSIDSQQELLEREKKTMDKIIKKGPGVPTEEWVEEVNNYKTALEEEIARVRGLYKETDKSFEEWFSALKCKPDEVPAPGAFIPRYQVARDDLIGLLKDKEITTGKSEEPDVSEEDIAKSLGFGDPNAEDHKTLQKRFWIQKKIIDVILQSDVVHCNKIGFVLSKEGDKQGSRFPEGLGTLIPFEITVKLYLSNVSTFTYKLIEYVSETPLMVIDEIIVGRDFDSIMQTVDEFYSKRLNEEEKSTWRPPKISLPFVQLTIKGRALDFEIN